MEASTGASWGKMGWKVRKKGEKCRERGCEWVGEDRRRSRDVGVVSKIKGERRALGVQWDAAVPARG